MAPEHLKALIGRELCFLWVVAVAANPSGDPEMIRRAISLCDRVVAQSGPIGPSAALRDWWRDPYWHQYALAFNLEGCDGVEGALRHYEAAIALRPSAPWAWFNRAHLYGCRRGAWELALRDLDRTATAASELPVDRVRILIERGKVHQADGDVVRARADYEAAMAVDPQGRLARAARLDRARLDAKAGNLRRARAAYDELVDSDPSDLAARRAWARLALRQAALAEAELTRLLTEGAGWPPAARPAAASRRDRPAHPARAGVGSLSNVANALAHMRGPGGIRIVDAPAAVAWDRMRRRDVSAWYPTTAVPQPFPAQDPVWPGAGGGIVPRSD